MPEDHVIRRGSPPFDEPALDLFAEEIRRARAMSPEEKLLEGPRLFDRACRLMAEGIRHAHPEFADDEVQTVLMERLNRLGRLEAP